MLRTEYEARAGQWSDIQGHLPTLHDAVMAYPGVRVLELGVRWGTSTACLLAAAGGGRRSRLVCRHLPAGRA